MTYPCCSSCGRVLRAHERDNGLCDRCEDDQIFRDPEPPEPDPHWDRLYDPGEAA